MPTFGEYIGALLGEVTNARVLADLETARIAELYAAHPLLAHMPVPRFRLPTVTLDMPVAVGSFDHPPAAPATADLLALRQKIDGIIGTELSQRGVHLTPNGQKTLTQGVNDLFDTLHTSTSITAADATKAAGDAVSLVSDAVKASTPDRGPATAALEPPVVDHAPGGPTLESTLRQQFGAEFLKLQPLPPRVQVTVVTAQLKDIGPAPALTRIQLTITEEGVEWSQTNPADPSAKTLLRE